MSEKKQQTAYPLRMPEVLRAKLEEAAASNKRSLNAEITARLEDSFHAEVPAAELIPASKAREIASAARKDLAVRVREAVLEQLNEAIMQGAESVDISLHRFPLLAYEADEAEEITAPIEKELNDAGYKTEWDGASSLWIMFSGKDRA